MKKCGEIEMLGEALKLIRVFHEAKQSELAQRLGISKSYLSEIERGDKTPNLALLEKYSREFGIPVSSILFFAENYERGETYERARAIVAAKIVKLMKFLEERSK